MKIVNKIKHTLNTGKPIDSQKFILSFQDYKVVSFDIFDTLLKRNVAKPTDVFAYIEQKFGIENFKQKRIEAERIARSQSFDSEISLVDIYNQYGIDYSKVELQAESELLTLNQDMFFVFQEAVKNKTVILTSDMYLPETFIVDILNREGITGYHKLYLSSTVGVTKSNGKIFDLIIEDLCINRADIIHIGDSFHSDYNIPRKKGIAAKHLPTTIKKSHYRLSGDAIEINIINSFINNSIPSTADSYYRFGYEKFGMFLWGFSKWLHESLLNENIQKVYFFSRDGLIMKQAFDMLFDDIETHYLEVSRSALRVPILWKNYSLDHVIDMISPSKMISLSSVFDGLGLNMYDYTDLLTTYNYSFETYFDRKELVNNKKFAEFYQELSADIESNSRNEYDLLVKYLDQHHIEGKFAIVDIGWSGGMQRYLKETLDTLKISNNITGYYIGIADYYKRNIKAVPSLNLNGYLFDFSKNITEIDKRRPFVGLFESLFLEQDGSVEKYINDNGVIKAKRFSYEYFENGKPTEEFQAIKKLQRGALDFVKSFGNPSIEISADQLFYGLEQTGLFPNKQDIKLFADFRFFDDGEINYLAKPQHLLTYLLHIRQLKKDFLMCRWKIGFLKRLLKIKLPYQTIYNYLSKYK